MPVLTDLGNRCQSFYYKRVGPSGPPGRHRISGPRIRTSLSGVLHSTPFSPLP